MLIPSLNIIIVNTIQSIGIVSLTLGLVRTNYKTHLPSAAAFNFKPFPLKLSSYCSSTFVFASWSVTLDISVEVMLNKL